MNSEMRYALNSLSSNFSGKLTSIDRTISSGLKGVEKNLSNISSQMADMEAELAGIGIAIDELIDEVRDWRAEQIIQHEEQKALLEDIGATLKKPNEIAADEQFKFAEELVRRKDYVLSINYFLEVIRLNPLHFLAMVYVSNIYCKLGQYEEALRHGVNSLKHTEEVRERKAISHYMISKAYFGLGNLDSAISEIEKALKLDPLPDYCYEGSRYYAFVENPARSMELLVNAINGNRNFFEIAIIDKIYQSVYLNLADTLIQVKYQTQQKVKTYKEEWDNFQMPIIPFNAYSHINTFAVNHYVKNLINKEIKLRSKIRGDLIEAERLMDEDTFIQYREAFDHLQNLEGVYKDSIKNIIDFLDEGLNKSKWELSHAKNTFPQIQSKIQKLQVELKKFPISILLSKAEKEKKSKMKENKLKTEKDLEKTKISIVGKEQEVKAFEELSNFVRNMNNVYFKFNKNIIVSVQY